MTTTTHTNREHADATVSRWQAAAARVTRDDLRRALDKMTKETGRYEVKLDPRLLEGLARDVLDPRPEFFKREADHFGEADHLGLLIYQLLKAAEDSLSFEEETMGRAAMNLGTADADPSMVTVMRSVAAYLLRQWATDAAVCTLIEEEDAASKEAAQ